MRTLLVQTWNRIQETLGLVRTYYARLDDHTGGHTLPSNNITVYAHMLLHTNINFYNTKTK